MSRRRVYLVAGFVFILVSLLMAVYPLGEYYFGRYVGSAHDVSTGNFTYVFELPVSAERFGWTELYTIVYHFQGLGNGKFNFTDIIYRGGAGFGIGPHYVKVNKNWRKPFIVNPKLPVAKVAEVHAVLNSTDPLIKFLFPKNSVYLHGKNREMTPYGLVFFPMFYGFGRLYVPEGFGDSSRIYVLRKYKLEHPVLYFKGSHRYYAFQVILAAEPDLRYIDYLELQKFVGNPLHINITKRTIIPYAYKGMGMIIPGGVMLLVQASVQPKVQDWAWAFKYSFTNYAAPVDYVLILIGLILLVLAGRARG